MKRFIKELDRSQTSLLPDCVDDYVDDDNLVRAVDDFVDMLDLAALGFDIEPEAMGRPGYLPSTMLKLYVYGYLNQVQSPRRLEWPAIRIYMPECNPHLPCACLDGYGADDRIRDVEALELP